jgi:hypothetical protein
MEYKIKPIKVDADKGETFPDHKDRVIEMRGQVVELTLGGIEQTNEQREKRIKELKAKKENCLAKVENVAHFHKNIVEMSEEDQHAAWMYYENKTAANICDKEIKKYEEYIEQDNKEIEEIKKQIPELATSEVVKEAENIINSK